MNYYETLYIVHPALESGRLKDNIASLEKTMNNLGGKILSLDLWGKKRLAYPIDKQKYGTYIMMQYTGEGNCSSNFGMELGHNPNVLSHLTILIQKSDVIEQKDDIDTQIMGHFRETKIKDVPSQNVDNKDISKQNKSEENSATLSVPPKVAASSEDPIEESAKIDREQVSSIRDDLEGSHDKSDTEKVDVLEDHKDSMKANQKNTDEKSIVSEEE